MSGASIGDKGSNLEESLKEYFWQAGYFVVRGIPYRLDDEDITDIDLWLYERPTASTRRRLIVDIKSRKSPRAAERLVWTRGLQTALGVDAAIVATTDNRPSSRRLSRRLHVTLLDGDAVKKISNSQLLKQSGQMASESLINAVKRIDESRRSTDWRNRLQDARASLLSGLGVLSANENLVAFGFYTEQVQNAQPDSGQAHVALRLAYHTAALAAISLDFMLASHAFRSAEDRRGSIIDGIRFGQSETIGTLSAIKTAIELARKYAENGSAVAKQIEAGFFTEAERIPAEIIADYVARISASDALFTAARELERASSAIILPSYDALSTEAKSLLGVFLDFIGISREKIAKGWTKVNQGLEEGGIAQDLGPLFAGSEASEVKMAPPTGRRRRKR